MTSIYCIRHSQPEHDWEDDRTRPLTDGGLEDSRNVTEFLRNIKIDCYISSPYKRSIDTIRESAIESFSPMNIAPAAAFAAKGPP